MKKILTLTLLLSLTFIGTLFIASPNLLAEHVPDHLTLQENQAGNDDAPFKIALNGQVTITLIGEETKNPITSSGSGSYKNIQWKPGQDLINDILILENYNEIKMPIDENYNEIKMPVDISTENSYPCRHQIITYPTWYFKAEQSSTVTLTFKKYIDTDALMFNLDGSPFYKDPVKEIHFTIQVVDPNETDANVNQ